MGQGVVAEWTGAEARALRLALRMPLRQFAAHLGVAPRTVSQWEARAAGIRPRPEMQAALDEALSRATPAEQTRFQLLAGDLGICGGRGEQEVDPTNRRELITAALGAAAVSALRGGASGGDPFDDEPDRVLTLVPAAYRRVEATTASERLIGPVTAHLRFLRHSLASTSGPPGTGTWAAISETAGLVAWLYTDLDERAAARRHYRVALAAAEHTGQPLLAAYMQASYGQFATAVGDGPPGLRLIATARKRAASWPPIAEAWFDVLTAGALAEAGDETALALVDRAETTLSRTPGQEPVWPWVYRFDDVKLAAYRAVVAARLLRADIAEAAFAVAEQIPRAPKQAALASVHRARALAADDRVERACALAVAALDTATALGSYAGVHAVARFRRELPPEAGALASALDDRLHAVYTQPVARAGDVGDPSCTDDIEPPRW